MKYDAEDTIKFSLSLEIDGEKIPVSCGNISKVEANLYSWGFDGKVEFWLVAKHAKPFLDTLSIILAELTIQPTHTGTEEPEPLLVKGAVTHRALLKEVVYERVEELPVMMRLCSITFKDFAQDAWSDHRPNSLYTDKTMQDVIEDNAQPLVPLKMEFEKLTKPHPILSFGLQGTETNFYSFLMWYLSESGGIWEYSHKEHTYTILGEKKADGKPLEIDAGKIASIACHFPRRNRAHRRILNGYVDDLKQKDIENPHAYESVRQDVLLNTPLAAPYDEAVKTATPLPTTHQHTLELLFKFLPDSSFIPDTLVAFTKKSWGKELFYKEKTYRVQSFHIHAEASNLEYLENNSRKEQGYFLDARAHLALKDESSISLPPFTPPIYPWFVDGEVFSEVGGEEQLTHQGMKNEETSQVFYRIEIPRYENQKVIVPFEPGWSDQFYFPHNKKTLIKVALFFQEARFDRLLRWTKRSLLPVDAQGNKLLMSPNSDVNSTFIYYGPEKEDDTLLIIEKRSPKQLQTIHLKEDGVQIKIHDEGEETYKASLHMDVDSNMTLITQNNAKDIVQVVNLKEWEISSTCEANGKKSSYVQTAEHIQIDVDKLTLNTKQTFLNSKETTHITSDDIYLVESKGTVTLKAAKELLTEANEITSTAKAASKLNATDITITGKSSFTVEATNATVKAKAVALMKGAIANINGSLINLN